MHARKSILFVGALIAGASVVAATHEDAFAAKKKKPACSAKMNGKGFKSGGARFNVIYSSALSGINFSAVQIAGSGFKTKTSTLALAAGSVPDPATATYPVTLNASGAFGVVGIGGGSGWATDGSTAVTIVLTKYDATHQQLFGTFSGTMAPGQGQSANLTIASGKFVATLVSQ